MELVLQQTHCQAHFLVSLDVLIMVNVLKEFSLFILMFSTQNYSEIYKQLLKQLQKIRKSFTGNVQPLVDLYFFLLVYEIVLEWFTLSEFLQILLCVYQHPQCMFKASSSSKRSQNQKKNSTKKKKKKTSSLSDTRNYFRDIMWLIKWSPEKVFHCMVKYWMWTDFSYCIHVS